MNTRPVISSHVVLGARGRWTIVPIPGSCPHLADQALVPCMQPQSRRHIIYTFSVVRPVDIVAEDKSVGERSPTLESSKPNRD
jgi:hypothetical protein